MPIMPLRPSDNPNTGANRSGNPGALVNDFLKNQSSKTHYGTDAAYASRARLVEDSFSSLQSLVDYGFGIASFMVGQGRAGFRFIFEGNTFEFGGRFNTPLGFVGNSPSGFSSSPGSTSFSSPTISPPNIVSNVTSSGPSGGVNH